MNKLLWNQTFGMVFLSTFTGLLFGVIGTMYFYSFGFNSSQIEYMAFEEGESDMYNWDIRPKTMRITWERDPVKVEKALRAYEKLNPQIVKSNHKVAGLAEIGKTTCKIYAPEPVMDRDYYSYIFAHEVSHCFGMRHE